MNFGETRELSLSGSVSNVIHFRHKKVKYKNTFFYFFCFFVFEFFSQSLMIYKTAREAKNFEKNSGEIPLYIFCLLKNIVYFVFIIAACIINKLLLNQIFPPLKISINGKLITCQNTNYEWFSYMFILYPGKVAIYCDRTVNIIS